MAALPPRSGGTAGEGGWEAAASSAARRGGELGGASLAMGTEEEKKERRKGGRSEGGRGCVGRGKRWGERVPSPVLPHGLTGLTAAKRKRDADGGEREVAGERAYSSSEVEEELERELAEVPLGELQKARADGSHVPSLKKLREEKKLRRLNKNRPMEMSSKVPVGRLREVIQAPKKVFRDPRFESLCGNLDKDGFRKRYGFLYDEELPSEKKKLQQVVKKTKDPHTVKELKEHISWVDKQLKSGSGPSRNSDAEILADHKKKEREAAKRGKQPFYLKKSEIRERKLVQKYNELKASGKLESFMEMKRKKNASKDARFLPYRRTNDDA